MLEIGIAALTIIISGMSNVLKEGHRRFVGPRPSDGLIEQSENTSRR